MPHLENVSANDRKKIQSVCILHADKQHITVGPYSAKQVSQSAQMTSEQPAVVAPELASDDQAPIPEIGQDAQTGPEIVGAEDPRHDSVAKKKTLTQKIIGIFKKN